MAILLIKVWQNCLHDLSEKDICLISHEFRECQTPMESGVCDKEHIRCKIHPNTFQVQQEIRSHLLQVSAIPIFRILQVRYIFPIKIIRKKKKKISLQYRYCHDLKSKRCQIQKQCFSFLKATELIKLWEETCTLVFNLSVTSIYIRGTTFIMVPTQRGSELLTQHRTVGVSSSPQVQPRVVLSSYKHVTSVKRRMMSQFHRYSTLTATGK